MAACSTDACLLQRAKGAVTPIEPQNKAAHKVWLKGGNVKLTVRAQWKLKLNTKSYHWQHVGIYNEDKIWSGYRSLCRMPKNVERDFDPFLSVCPPAANLRNILTGNLQKRWSWRDTDLINFQGTSDMYISYHSISVQWVSSSSTCIYFMSLLKSLFNTNHPSSPSTALLFPSSFPIPLLAGNSGLWPLTSLLCCYTTTPILSEHQQNAWDVNMKSIYMSDF